jgi:hypothetical protein
VSPISITNEKREESKERKEELMSAKWSKKWYKRVGREWDRYIGHRATLEEYAAGGEPYLTRLRQDLKKWWGNHPEPAERLTPEEIEAVAQRLADLLKAYTSPITPPETADLFRSQWSTFVNNVIPDGSPRGTRMDGRSVMSGNEGGEGQKLES